MSNNIDETTIPKLSESFFKNLPKPNELRTPRSFREPEPQFVTITSCPIKPQILSKGQTPHFNQNQGGFQNYFQCPQNVTPKQPKPIQNFPNYWGYDPVQCYITPTTNGYAYSPPFGSVNYGTPPKPMSKDQLKFKKWFHKYLNK